jgi:hypothetical protein
MNDTTILGRDKVSVIAENDGIIFRLTNCCEASGKGGERGVICRACYQPVDDEMGMAWVARTSPLADEFYPEKVEA